MSLRILLAEDHEVVREGLRALLEKQPGMEIVGEVSDGREAVRQALQERPDVVLMDLSMSKLNGIEATRQITAREPAVKVLCLSVHAMGQYVLAALEAGAAGYLVKECALKELLRALAALEAGGTYLCPMIAGTVVEAYKVAHTAHPASASGLTVREREVLQLIAEGETSKGIAKQLGLSAKTVGGYRESLMKKLDIHTTAGLVKYAIREGLVLCEDQVLRVS